MKNLVGQNITTLFPLTLSWSAKLAMDRPAGNGAACFAPASCQPGDALTGFARRLCAAIGILAILFLSGCAGSIKHMQLVEADAVRDMPSADKSMVVFMRPSGFGYAIQSSVFDVTGQDPEIVGIVAAKAKVAHETDPGKRLFMVIGESADFMHADLEAGKTYYALVTPRMGAWKARFSLEPVKAGELGSDQFNEWHDSCKWVEKSDTTDLWAQENMSSIVSKQQKYYPEWLKKAEADQPRLDPGDGR